MVFSPLAISDFRSGKAAYDAGRYLEARQLWEDAVKQGDVESLYELGKMYAEGLGALRNLAKSHAYFNVAAAKGDKRGLQAREILEDSMTAAQLAEAEKFATELHSQLLENVAPEPKQAKCVASAIGQYNVTRLQLVEGWMLETPLIELKYLLYRYPPGKKELFLSSNIAALDRRSLLEDSSHEFLIDECTYILDNIKLRGTYRTLEALEFRLSHK